MRTMIVTTAVLAVAVQAAPQSPVPPPVAVLQPASGVAQAALQSPPQPEPVTQLDLDQRDPDLDRARMSLVVERPAAIRDVLMLLVRGTRLSLVPAPGPALEQPLVADLKNVTIRESLEALLEPLALDYSLDGRLLRVFPRELETRFYDVDYVGAREIAEAPDLHADLQDGVRALLSPDGRVHLDRLSSLLHVTDRPSRLDRVERYVQLALRRATRQVQIEATFIEVDLDPSSGGLDWPALLEGLTAGTAPPAPGTRGMSTVTLPGGSPEPVRQALASQGTPRIVVRSRVLAMNNQPVFIRSESTGGFSLRVTPQISSRGEIAMSVHPRVTAERVGAVADRPTVLSVRETDTVVRVRDGDTVLLSGFVRTADAAYPRVTDMVILLTPTTLAPGARAAMKNP